MLSTPPRQPAEIALIALRPYDLWALRRWFTRIPMDAYLSRHIGPIAWSCHTSATGMSTSTAVASRQAEILPSKLLGWGYYSWQHQRTWLWACLCYRDQGVIGAEENIKPRKEAETRLLAMLSRKDLTWYIWKCWHWRGEWPTIPVACFGTTRMDADSLLKRLFRSTCSIIADMVVVQMSIDRGHD